MISLLNIILYCLNFSKKNYIKLQKKKKIVFDGMLASPAAYNEIMSVHPVVMII